MTVTHEVAPDLNERVERIKGLAPRVPWPNVIFHPVLAAAGGGEPVGAPGIRQPAPPPTEAPVEGSPTPAPLYPPGDLPPGGPAPQPLSRVIIRGY